MLVIERSTKFEFINICCFKTQNCCSSYGDHKRRTNLGQKYYSKGRSHNTSSPYGFKPPVKMGHSKQVHLKLQLDGNMKASIVQPQGYKSEPLIFYTNMSGNLLKLNNTLFTFVCTSASANCLGIGTNKKYINLQMSRHVKAQNVWIKNRQAPAPMQIYQKQNLYKNEDTF